MDNSSGSFCVLILCFFFLPGVGVLGLSLPRKVVMKAPLSICGVDGLPAPRCRSEQPLAWVGVGVVSWGIDVHFESM